MRPWRGLFEGGEGLGGGGVLLDSLKMRVLRSPSPKSRNELMLQARQKQFRTLGSGTKGHTGTHVDRVVHTCEEIRFVRDHMFKRFSVTLTHLLWGRHQSEAFEGGCIRLTCFLLVN